MAAARALGTTQSGDFLGDQRRDFDAAVADLKTYVQANSDIDEAQSTYGSFLFEQRRIDEAEKAFHQAIAVDPTLPGARINLAELYRTVGDNEKSEQTYAEAMPDAIREFEEAVRLDPDSSRYRTTAAIALDSVGRTEDAFMLIDPAPAGGETDATLLRTALQFGLKLGRYAETLRFAEALARLQPNDPETAELVRQLQIAARQGK